MRYLGLLAIAAFAVLLVWATGDLPYRGDPTSPASTGVSTYYIESAYEDSHTPNMVTAVLADYRGFDTFGEAVVVVTAALACLLVLLRRREEEDEGPPERSPYEHHGPDPDPDRVVHEDFS